VTTKSHERRAPVELRRWNEDVIRYARAHGWKVNSNPGAHHGFPQIVMVRSLPTGDRRLLFVRLVDSNDHVSHAQKEWLHALEQVSLMCSHHVVAYAWKPEDWPAVQEALK
jgi:hypothetical protein